MDQCFWILQQLYPVCFGGFLHGAFFDSGGDVQVCLDGNFHHCYLKYEGEGSTFYDPKRILLKEFIDTVRIWIVEAHKFSQRSRKFQVLDKAVDECKKAQKAANGNKEIMTSEKFDANGLMTLVYWHDIPLFFVNINTSEEQQKYTVALILHLFSLIPAAATVLGLYNIACILAHSLQLVGFISG